MHDELLLEVDAAAVRQVAQIVRECMEGAVSLRVPFPVKIKVGPSWGELQPFED